MDTSSARSASPSVSFIALLLAAVTAAGLIQHWVATVDDPPPRIYKAEGYVNRVRVMLESPTKALVLENKKLVFHAERADRDERLFYQHNRWLREDIRDFNEGQPGFFYLQRGKSGLTMAVDAHAHNLPLPVTDSGDAPEVSLSGQVVPVLSGAGLRLVFDVPREGSEALMLEALPWFSSTQQEEWNHFAPAFHLRWGGQNLLLLTQKEKGRITLEPQAATGVSLRLNGTLLEGAGSAEKLEALRGRVQGHRGSGFPLVDGDRLLLSTRTGRRLALRFSLSRGEMWLAGCSGQTLELQAQAVSALKILQGTPGLKVSGVMQPMTLDPRLHAQVDQALQKKVRSLNAELRSKHSDIDRRPACVTVLDAMTGEALALATYPDAEKVKQWQADFIQGNSSGLSRVQADQLSRNQNFNRVPIGSTTKPLLAAAIWETAPVLRRLHVDGGRLTYSMYGHDLGDPMRNPSSQPSWGPVEWLENSSNPYTLAAYLAALAPADSFTLDGRGRLQPKGARLDLSRWLKGRNVKDTFFQHGTDSPDTPAVNAKLAQCFDIGLRANDKPRYDASTIIPWLAQMGLGEQSVPAALRAQMPETTHLEINKCADLRYDIVSMVIGGGGNRWTNLKLAEAYARLGTGLKVAATTVQREKAPVFPAMPVSTATLELVREGMTAVVMGSGTAATLKPQFQKEKERLARLGWKLIIHGKTGTATRIEGRECAAMALYLALHDARDQRRAALACTIFLEDRANTSGALNSTNAVKLMGEITPALIARLERQAMEKK